jgi:transcriptional repressor BetI
MPKLGMEPVRRRQMIDATIRTIHEVGFPNTSLARVAGRAGVSQGLVAHYFRDKAGLLEATMRHIAGELKAEVVAHRQGLADPRARLDAVLEANFSPRSFAPESLAAWVAFWGQTHRNPQLGRIQRVLRVRLKSNLAYDLRQLVADAEARRIAQGLSIFVDGLSLRTAMGERALDRRSARAFAFDYLDTELAKNGVTRERSHAAQG